MQAKTRAIILHALKYNDKANIITAYTLEFGRISYMVYAANKKKSTFRTSFMQPLTIVELDVFHSPSKELQRVKDVRNIYLFTRIPYDPIKNALALFISEMLFRTLRQAEPDEALYNFIENSIQQLDCTEAGIANFHLVFFVKLARYLGFEVNIDEVNPTYFDLLNGIFVANKPLHYHYLTPDTTLLLRKLLEIDFSNFNQLSLGREQRNLLLDCIIDYYKLHVPDFKGPQSVSIFQQLFD